VAKWGRAAGCGPWKARLAIACALGLALWWLLACPVRAAKTQANAPSLIVILLPGTSLVDWQRADAPHLHALMAGGALAVMNTRTARTGSDKTRESEASVLLTLGSGARAAGDNLRLRFVSAGQSVLPGGVTAAELYQRRMGSAPPGGAWVDVDWPRVLGVNKGRGYDIHLGNLADALAARGVSVQAGGGQYALPLVCNSLGTAQVSPTLRVPPSRAVCVVWDADNDIARADQVVGRAMRLEAQAQGRVLVLSPFASGADYARGARLTPAALWGAGVAPGLLFSRSTRRTGLVTDTDFAPSVADYFGAALPALPFGQAWTVRPVPHAEARVLRLQAGAYRQASGMRVLPAFAVVLGLYMLACSAAVFRGQRGASALASFPVVSLAALLLSGSVFEWAVWLAVLGSGAALLMRSLGAARAVTIFCALVVGVGVIDLLCGDPLMRYSLLGYSAIEGARYYGIGNEAMGVFVGAALCLAWRLWPVVKQRWGRWGIAVGLIGLATLLGLPAFGAKAGSVFVAVPTFGVLLWMLSGRRLRRQSVLILAALAVCAMAGIVLLDRHAGGAQSHVGQAVARITQGGLGEAWDIVARKLSVEGHLLVRSAWAVLLWSGVVGLSLLAQHKRADKHLSALLMSGAVAAGASLAFNDAGTVACALCLAVVWSTSASARNK